MCLQSIDGDSDEQVHVDPKLQCSGEAVPHLSGILLTESLLCKTTCGSLGRVPTSVSCGLTSWGIQDLYNRIYADPVALQHYHADVNHASNVSVEPWLDDKRTVRFTISVALPAVIKKAIGTLHDMCILVIAWVSGMLQDRMSYVPGHVLTHQGQNHRAASCRGSGA